MTATAPAWRSDIDGLRAVTVLPVVLCHAGDTPLYFGTHHLTLAGVRLVPDSAANGDKGSAIGQNRNYR